MKLQAEGLSYSYGCKLAVDSLSFSVEDGEFVGLIGPNGSGKSTALKMIYRALRPQAGRILLDGQDLLKMPYRQSAQMLAAVSQENEVPFSFTVEEIAAMGRSPHKRFFEADALEDKRIVAQALAQLGLTDLSAATTKFPAAKSSGRSSPALWLSNAPSSSWTNRLTTWISASRCRFSAW